MFGTIREECRTSSSKQRGVGEQGDPLMPALHAPGQHPALQAAHSHLREETLVAFFFTPFSVQRQ